MRLIHHITEADPLTPLWSSRGKLARRGQVLQFLAKQEPVFTGSLPLNVALLVSDPERFFLSLMLFDGLANQILIIPDSVSEKLLDEFVGKVGCNTCVYCGKGSPPSGWTQTESIADFQEQEAGQTQLEELLTRNTDSRWIIPTSGTTGSPKLVSHTLGTLTRTIKSDKAQGVKLAWGLAYDPSRFAGLQVFLQALCGGSSLVLPQDVNDLESLPEDFSKGGCNALSATPSMWRKLLMTKGIETLDLRVISLGGEIADQGVLSALAARFPSARLTHIYASTEAGVGFSVKDGLAGFPSSFLNEPPPGVSLRVNSDGFLLVKHEHLQQDYVGGEIAISDESGWINTGDLVELRESRYYFRGRANGSINVGGRKVHPQEVEEVILGVEGVALAKVMGRRNSILGNLVEAHILPRIGEKPESLKSEVNRVCAQRLEDYKRPVMVKVVDQIETSPSGKIIRS